MTMDDILPQAQTPTPINGNDSSLYDELLRNISPIERKLVEHFGVRDLGGGRFARLWSKEEQLLAEIFGEVVAM
jgi:hypothetical protein